MNTENSGVVGDVLILEDVHAPVFHIIIGHLRHGRGACHPADKQQRCQNHSSFNCHGEIGEDSECKCYQPDTDISFRQFQQLRNFTPHAHVVGDDDQNSCERSHRHIADQGRSEQQNAQQR